MRQQSITEYISYFDDQYAELKQQNPNITRTEANKQIQAEWSQHKRTSQQLNESRKESMIPSDSIQIYLKVLDWRIKEEQFKQQLEQNKLENPPQSSQISNASTDVSKHKLKPKVSLQINYCNSDSKYLQSAKQTIMNLRSKFTNLTIYQSQMHGQSRAIEIIKVQEDGNKLMWHTLLDGDIVMDQLIDKIIKIN